MLCSKIILYFHNTKIIQYDFNYNQPYVIGVVHITHNNGHGDVINIVDTIEQIYPLFESHCFDITYDIEHMKLQYIDTMYTPIIFIRVYIMLYTS